ncbi:MAG: Yip1 family protein [Halobaculum sp.]
MFRLVTNPDRFFAERVDDPQAAAPTLAVTGAAITSLFPPAVVFSKLLAGASAGTFVFVGTGVAIAMISGLFAMFALWLFVSSVCHAVARRLDGSGGFRTVLLLCGWGFLPTAVGGLVSAAFLLAFVDPGAPSESVSLRVISRQIQQSAGVRAAGLLGVLFTVWSGVLWTFALRQAHDLSLVRAAGAATPVTVLLIGVSVGSLV